MKGNREGQTINREGREKKLAFISIRADGGERITFRWLQSDKLKMAAEAQVFGLSLSEYFRAWLEADMDLAKTFPRLPLLLQEELAQFQEWLKPRRLIR